MVVISQKVYGLICLLRTIRCRRLSYNGLKSLCPHGRGTSVIYNCYNSIKTKSSSSSISHKIINYFYRLLNTGNLEIHVEALSFQRNVSPLN